MSIENILVPKTKEQIEQSINEYLKDAYPLKKFIEDYKPVKRELKTYAYIISKLDERADNIYIISDKNSLYRTLVQHITGCFMTNSVRKKVDFTVRGSCFNKALIYGEEFAILEGGSLGLTAIMIGKDKILKKIFEDV
jgi:hypothetical protein